MTRMLVVTPSAVIAVAERDGWTPEPVLQGVDVRVLARDPQRPDRVWAGTQGSGLLRSDDRGATWRRAGLAGQVVKAIAVGPDGRVWAGTKPPALFVSSADGDSWREVEEFGRMRRWFWVQPAEWPPTPYVDTLAVSPADPDVVLAGIEAFRVLRTTDGGASWERQGGGLAHDCHALEFHASAHERAYEGAGLGAALSRDGGATWQRCSEGLERRYIMCMAVDPADPDLWYAGCGGMMSAHGPNSHAAIARWRGERWELLDGGISTDLQHLPHDMTAPAPGVAFAGLRDGAVWRSRDSGDSWQQLPVQFDGLRRMLVWEE